MEKIKAKIRNVSLFKDLKDDEGAIDKIARLIAVKNFPKDSHIIREGDKGDEMFILNKGSVRVEKTTMDDDTYTVVKLEDFMNIFFGEMALIDDDVRSASVVADTDCECFVIRKGDFHELAGSDCRIGYSVTTEIAKILSVRLRKSSADTITLFEALVAEIGDVG